MLRRAVGLPLLFALLAADARAFVWPSTVDQVQRDLLSPDTGVRRRAARELLVLPAASVRRVGPAALDDADADVRITAFEALVLAHAEGTGVRVAAWLSDPEARVRRAAAEALARVPVASAVPALGRVLADPDATVRVAAARALGASGSPSATVPLLGRLDDTEAEVRETIVLALSRLGDRSAVVPLIGKIQDGRPSVRRGVAVALGALGDNRASGALALALRDSDESVRVAALDALGRISAEDAVATIISLLNEERRPAVREAAFNALADIPSEAGLDALVRALGDDDPRERSPVRSALVRAGKRAAPKLVACLEGQPLPNQADGCALALGEIGTKDGAAAIGVALRRGVVRPQAALKALASSGNAAGLGTVLEYLSSEDPWVRRAAVEAASALLDPAEPDGRAVEPIARALDAAHGRPAEQAALVGLLGKTGSARAEPVLASVVREASGVALRRAALTALGWVGKAGQDEVLLGALGDPDPTIRLAAAAALRRVGSPSTAFVLLDRLERAAEQDRGALALALVGPLSSMGDPGDLLRAVSRIEKLLEARDGAERDALVEALGALRGRAGSGALDRLLSASAEPATRSKVAESLAAHPEDVATLLRLASDREASVRANAVWALGRVAGATDSEQLAAFIGDSDSAVAGNAVAALAGLGARGANVAPVLCRVIADPRRYVRANALAGLTALRSRCDDGAIERRVLAADDAELVRAAAARLIATVPSSKPGSDAAALSQCVVEDANGTVASSCRSERRPGDTRDGEERRGRRRDLSVTVFVVPSGAMSPLPRAPFALVTSDGAIRLGLADRRGAVHDPAAPAGALRLEIPAPLVE